MRWKALIPALLLTALLVVFCVFFLDGLVRRGIEKAGTAINGAEVNLRKADVSFRNLSLTLSGLQVTDRDKPLTNAVEIATLRFDLGGKPLTWKKIIIEKGEILGVQTGTARKSSGALPFSKKDKEEDNQPSALSRLAKETGSFAVSNLKEQYDPKKMIDVENLASLKRIKEEQANAAQVTQEWKGQVAALSIEQNTAAVNALVKKIEGEKFSGIEGAQKAAALLKEAEGVRSNLKGAEKSFKNVRDSLQSQFARAQGLLAEIDDLKKSDWENAVKNVGGGLFSVDGITQGLIGPHWFGKLQTGLSWFEKIRRVIPEKKEGNKPPPPVPRVGRDISFPFRYAWPAFHLKTAAVTGVTPGENGVAYEGTLKDVSSDAQLIGRPVTLTLSGRRTQTGEALSLKAEVDRTKDVPRDAVNLTYSGVPLAGIEMGKVGGPVRLKSGKGVVTADVEVKGEALSGQVAFDARPVTIEHTLDPSQAGNRLLGLVQKSVSQVKSLNVTFVLSDTYKSPNVKFKTTLDNEIKNAIEQVFKKELEDLKAQARARVEELVGEQQRNLTSVFTGGKTESSSLLDEKEKALAGLQDQVNKAIGDLAKKNSSGLEELKGLFKKK